MQRTRIRPYKNLVRDELLLRLSHYRQQLVLIDQLLEQQRSEFPQVEALLDIYGIKTRARPGPYRFNHRQQYLDRSKIAGGA